MKIFLLLLGGMFIGLCSHSQVITSIQINLPQNPDANTANWKTGASMLTITATAKMINGRVEPQAEECRMLVIVKKNGSKVCGSYQASSAPMVSFNAAVKVWTGAAAIALIGQDCELTPGDYECSVQFFNRQGNASMSAEKTKAFTIPAPVAIQYQLPQPLAPANGSAVTGLKTPLTFRWTPLVPRPAEAVSYRLRIWQLKQGQNSTQAVNASQPIYTKDIDNMTQLPVVNLVADPCPPSSPCEFAWNVQAIGRDGKPLGGNNGTSESWRWKLATEQLRAQQVRLLSPGNGATVTARNIGFSWQADSPDDADGYKIKIVEIVGDQSPENALRTNKPIFEKDSALSFKGNKPFFEKDSITLLKGNKPIFEKDSGNWYPSGAGSFQPGKRYAWKVDVLDKEKKVSASSSVAVFNVEEDAGGGGGGKRSTTITATDSTAPPPVVADTASAAVGDTIRAGYNGEFLIKVTDITKEANGSLSGKGIVDIGWLSKNIAVEFSKIRIDSTKLLTAGGIVTQKSSGANYVQAWLIANLTAEAATIPLDKPVAWANNTVDNLVSWANSHNAGLPDLTYQANLTTPVIPPNSLKMPFGVKFGNPDDKLMITEIVFKPNVSKINFLVQKKFTRATEDYLLGFAGKYFEIHPRRIDFSNGRVELVENIAIPNLSADPKMKFIFQKGSSSGGCYIEWDSTGVKDIGLAMDIKFTRNWLLPIPTSPDSVKASVSGNGTSMQDILLKGSLPYCEIVGAKGMKLMVDSVCLDLSETRNASFMHFPANYNSDTSAQGRLLWQGLYIKTQKLTLPDAWKTVSGGPPQITITNTLIDDQGITLKAKAINIIQFPMTSVADMSASLDTLQVAILKSSLTEGSAKGKLVLPISRDTITNTLKYSALFAQADTGSSLQIVIKPSGPIDADVLKGRITLAATSNISTTITGNSISASIKLDGSFSWNNPLTSVPATADTSMSGPGVQVKAKPKGIKGLKMEMDFQNLSYTYTNNWDANTHSSQFNLGSWSFASPQKSMLNFPVTIKKIYYKSLTKGTPSDPAWKEMERGAVMMDIVANLTDEIGGSTTIGAAFSLELNTSARKFRPKFKGISLDSVEVHADLSAVKIDGSLKLYDSDPVYGDGFLAMIGVRFNAVALQANALVQFGNTEYNNNNQRYRYWRAEADVQFTPGIPFLTGVGFYGFGGGAFYNMEANLVQKTAPAVGYRYVFKPKKSSFGFTAMATIGTLPKFETFNADVKLLAQFNANTGGLTQLGFTGDFWLAASLAQRPASKIKGGVAVNYNFPDKVFYMAGLLSVNVPPAITTPSPIGFVLNIDGKNNKWYFKSGTPTATNNVNIFGMNLYSYLMFGNDIPVPNGFTQAFSNKYHSATGEYPNAGNVGTGGVGQNTATGKGIAAGVGIEFSRNANKDLFEGTCRKWSLGGTLKAGAELNLSLMHQTGCEGINGYRASGGLGLYGYVDATIKGTGYRYGCDNKSLTLFRIKAGAWITGKFPNPEYIAGALSANIDLFEGLCKTHYYQAFESGTDCNGTQTVTEDAPQEDEAADLKNKLIDYVAPNNNYYFPVNTPVNVKYHLTPDELFDVSENQGDGTTKNRTFKLEIVKSLEVKNADGTWTTLTLFTKVNNLGEYQYYIKNLNGGVLGMGGSTASFNTNTGGGLLVAGNMLGTTTVLNPVPPPPPPFPNPAPPAVNHLEPDKNYRFKVTATLKELIANNWTNAVTRTGQPINQTKTFLFRTGGPEPVQVQQGSINKAK
jgi:hypothetical protein